MRRAMTIFVILAAIVGGGVFGYRIFAQERSAAKPSYETYVVGRGTIVSTVSATGSIEPEQRVDLAFKSIGRVAEVYVKAGDSVKAGQLLAALETTDLKLALAQAEATLQINQARLEQVRKGPDEGEIAAAKAQLESAQAAYRQLLAGPSEDEKRAAMAAVERARAALEQAQAAYDQVAHMPNVGMLPQSLQLRDATIELERAEAQYRMTTAPPTEAQIAQAQAQIAQAQANLDRLLKGPSAEEIKIAEAQVAQAQAAVEQARLALENAILTAPFDGIVAAVNIRPGEIASSALAAIVLIDPSRFHIDVKVDEVDIGHVKEGQPVEIRLDALPEAKISGHIERISPIAQVAGGVVSYDVTIVIEPTDAPLRAGMTATANIVTTELRDVLVVPNRFIRMDRENNKTYVEKVVDNIPVPVEITVGARNEQFSQVLRGLEEGDVLALRNVSGREQLRQSMFGNRDS
ncbi:MAG: efflux RND transporter periplasmic adaptor subunit [Anaerolineae bacterium]|nr:efflux RND transporter periplasmic adaptor subunit [Anaerolineae bacterium]MDW8097954.1 efflux RND transporter periplasmic adaptor subunit [Anaerolineae bacterium]